jgi:hypothetical protein
MASRFEKGRTAVTVRELIEKLQLHPPEMEVYVRYSGYGDIEPIDEITRDSIECVGGDRKDVVLLH